MDQGLKTISETLNKHLHHRLSLVFKNREKESLRFLFFVFVVCVRVSVMSPEMLPLLLYGVYKNVAGNNRDSSWMWLMYKHTHTGVHTHSSCCKHSAKVCSTLLWQAALCISAAIVF